MNDIHKLYYFFIKKTTKKHIRKSSNNNMKTVYLEISQMINSFYKIGFVLILIFIVSGTINPVLSQNNNDVITGFVTDENGEPLAGVKIVIKGSSGGTLTDADGRFQIDNIPVNSILVFSFTGLKTQEVLLRGTSSVNVVMEEDLIKLAEIVSIGYGKTSRANLTTAVSKMDNKVLETVPLSNIAVALQGTVSGVRVQQSQGQPGTNPIVIVRGGTSINNPNGSTPLYIIDGVIKPNLSDINQDEIESIQVLKDAASTSIYGARGSNGVVLITTKTGKIGKSQVTYSTDVSFSNVSRFYDFMSSGDWIYYMRKGVQATLPKRPGNASLLTQPNGFGTGNDLSKNTFFTTQYLTDENKHKLDEGWKSIPDPLDSTKTIIYDEFNYKDVMFRTAISQNHSLSFSGGNSNASFGLILGYQKTEGIVVHTNYNRYSVNFSGQLKVNKNLDVFGKLIYSNSSTKGVPVGLGVAFQRINAPTTKLYFEDGTISQGSSLYMGANPEYPNMVQDSKSSTDNTTIIAGARYEIVPGLFFEPQLSLFLNHYNYRFFRKAFYNGPTLDVSRTANSNFSKMTQPQVDAVFSYYKDFLKNHIDIQAGTSYYYKNDFSINASGKDAPTDLISTLNGSATPVSVGGIETEHLLLGYFGRINYIYDQKYLLSLTARYDGASNLGRNSKWGLFPGISAGWNLHNEKFFKESQLNNLLTFKLRSSYGVNGNISGIGLYTAQGGYVVGPAYGGVGTIQNSILANQNLRWERSNTLNFGFDLGLFNQRFNIIFDIYRRVTVDLLADMTLPPSTGFSGITTNLSNLENKGIDIEINAKLLPVTSKLQWDLSVNGSFIKNKILKLPDNGVENNRIGGFYVWNPSANDYAWKGGLQEGGTMGDLYAYKQLGVYSTDAEAQAGPQDMLVTGTDKTKYGGDVNWLDSDGNNIIDARDMVYVGNIYPKFFGGFVNSFSYKGINLYVRMDYMMGHTIFNQNRMWFLGNGQGGNHLVTDLLRSWQKQGDVTDIPRYYWNDQSQRNLFRGNSIFYEKGDYLAVREVTLSYTLPSKVFRNKITGLNLHVSGNNLYYLSKYLGPSPEEGGTDNGRYPMPRNIIVGLKLIL